MAADLEITSSDMLLHVEATGQLTNGSYVTFADAVEQHAHVHGKVRVLFEMRSCIGWTLGSNWKNMKFDLRHWKAIERLAIVDEVTWLEEIACFCRPFTWGTIEYFDHSHLDEAKDWLTTSL
ncbi:hypothetical protein CA13_27110 [Planctomycetes bacterium CA13]|uniref:STAS/SEC14 domain-containing protein n=1 Tax=Novipirellula herctigrandis TaxID=2527986 RepID=A0A5C5Z255_9BACT|nr:hypothetical protein CA13_27110 [Planctomycetes bacterium CA13]